MIVLLQRVLEAQVVRRAEGGQAEEPLGAVGRGLLAFVCAEPGDSAAVIAKAARKTARLRIFEDENGRMNLSAADIGGGVLVVSQFTLGAVRVFRTAHPPRRHKRPILPTLRRFAPKG